METNERMELVVRTAAKLSPEARIRVAERILETGDKPERNAKARLMELTVVAEVAVGCKVDGTRRASSVMIRRFCAWRMREEGYMTVDIARAMGVNHATVYHYVRQMQTCFEMPFYYHNDMELFTRFTEQLEAHEQVREPQD